MTGSNGAIPLLALADDHVGWTIGGKAAGDETGGTSGTPGAGLPPTGVPRGTRSPPRPYP